MSNIIEIKGLSKRFKNTLAVNDLTLDVPAGSIFAFLGPNGAGKTTTIKLLMNIIEPCGGSSTVLGTDSSKLGPEEFRQIGYVSENQKMPEWMSIKQFIAYCKPMYPEWDDDFCQKLIEQFKLPLEQKIKDLSRGMKVKTALLSALSYHPKLLVFDEPFAGLDPLVREEFIKGVLELTESGDWTIFISSHDIDEVERLADWVGIIDKGTLQLTEKIEMLQARFRKVEVTMKSALDSLPALPEDWFLPEHEGRIVRFIDSQYEVNISDKDISALFPDCADIIATEMSLREIFIAFAKTFNISKDREELL